MNRKECYRLIDAHPVENFWLRHCIMMLFVSVKKKLKMSNNHLQNDRTF